MNRFSWSSAQSMAEASSGATATVAALMSRAGEALPPSGAIFKAGGIDVLDLMKEGLLAPATLVSLSEVAELRGIAPQADGGVRIGSMVTLADVAAHALIRERYPALAEAAGESASPQIRHVATVGGNLLQRPRCWYFRSLETRCLRRGGDRCFALFGENRYHAIFHNRPCAIVHPSSIATALVALGATLEIVDPAAASRRESLEEFLAPAATDMTRENRLERGDILSAVLLSPPPANTRTVYSRFAEKRTFDWPVAEVALSVERSPDGAVARAALVLGAAAPMPYRARQAEAALIGRRIDADTAVAAGRAAIAHATPLTGNAYKVPLFETLVRRAVLAAR